MMRKNGLNFALHWMLINVLPQIHSLTMNKTHRYILKAYTPPINSTASYTIIVYKQSRLIEARRLHEEDVNNFDPKWWEKQYYDPQEMQLLANVTFRVNGIDDQSLPHTPQTPAHFNPNHQPPYPSGSNPHYPPPLPHAHVPQYPHPPSHYSDNPPPSQEYPPYTHPPPYNPSSYSHNFSQPSSFSQYPNQSWNSTYYNTTSLYHQNETKRHYTNQKVHPRNAGVNIIPNYNILTLSSFMSVLYVFLNL